MTYFNSLKRDDTINPKTGGKTKMTYAWMPEEHKANFDKLLVRILLKPREFEYFLREGNWDLITLYFKANYYKLEDAL